jgi:hypothetical protein
MEILDAVRTHDHKLVVAATDEDTVFYRLPDEGVDVSADFPEVRECLLDEHESWATEHAEPIVDSVEETDYDEAAERRLKELGYLE